MAETTYLSLFAGVGGLDLGLRIACGSARCLGYVEVGIEAAEVLAARIDEGSLDNAPVWSDVRTFPSELYRGRVAGIVAGFPCPDYSVAGKRAGIVGKHGQLWDWLAIAIRDVGPDWVLLENVPGILVSHGGEDGEGTLPAGLWFVLGDLSALGYDAQWIALRASDVGASHGRNRWFCLAYRAGGGCRELREPSRSDGLADGSHAVVAQPESERPSRAGSAPESSAAAADAGGRSNAVADSGDGLLPLAGRRPGGRDGAGSAGPLLADTELARWQKAGSGRAFDTGREPEPGYGGVEHAPGSRLSGRQDHGADSGHAGEVGSGSPEPDGRCIELGHADLARLEGRGLSGYGSDERAAGQAGDSELANAASQRGAQRAGVDDEGWTLERARAGANGRIIPGGIAERIPECGGTDSAGSKRVRGGEEELADTDCKRGERMSERRAGQCAEESGAHVELPLFAPGPGAAGLWQRILREHPELAPALSAEETESLLLRVAPGNAPQLDFEDRTDKLRSLGNLVVPLQAAVAITVLARRAGISLREGDIT